jgi:proteasome accessory factor B
LDSPDFAVLRDAVSTRTRVRFEYRGTTRLVEPWELIYRHGVSYLLAFEPVSEKAKLFRLGRMASRVEPVGKPDAFQIPAETQRQESLRGLEPPEPDREAVIAIRENRAPWLPRTVRLRGTRKLPDGFSAWLVPYNAGGDIVSDLAGYGPDVIVLEPPELAEAVRTQLRFVASGQTGSAVQGGEPR